MTLRDDNSRQFVAQGAKLLDQAIENSSDFSGDKTQSSDQLYLDAVKLSNELKGQKIFSFKSGSISESSAGQIKNLVDAIIDDFEVAGKELSPELGPGSSSFEALRVAAFALLVINRNISNRLKNAPSEPENAPLFSKTVDTNAVRLENAQLKKKILDFQSQIESAKMLSDEVMKQNTAISNERNELAARANSLEVSNKELEGKIQNLRAELQNAQYEKEAQKNYDQNLIEKLKEKSSQDERKIQLLEKKSILTPNGPENSYFAAAIASQTDGIEELMQYIESEFHISQSLSPRAIVTPLKQAINRLKNNYSKENDFIQKQRGEYAFPINASQPDVEKMQQKIFFLQNQIESDRVQIDDLKAQIALLKNDSKSLNFDSSPELERFKSSPESKIDDLMTLNLSLETMNHTLKTEKEKIEAELQATKQILKDSNGNRVSFANINPDESTKVFALESELKATKAKINDYVEICSKRRKKIQELKKLIRNLQDDLKMLNSQLENSKMQNEKIILERDDLLNNKVKKDDTDKKSVNSDYKILKDENTKLMTALSELSIEMESVTSQLEKESLSKNYIFNLYQRQSQALLISETQINNLLNQLKQKNDEIRLSQESIEALKIKTTKKFICTHREVIDNIQHFYITNPPPKECQEKITEFLNRDQDTISTVLDILNFLNSFMLSRSNSSFIQDQKEYMKLRDQNDRLFVYISNILRFLDQLANSGELQQWIIDSSYQIDIRPQLLAQYARLETFINQNCHETELKDICNNITDFPAFLNNFTSGQLINDNKEQVLIMQLCFMSNDLLHRITENLTTQNKTLQTDINILRREVTKSDNEIKEKIKDATKEKNSEINQEKENRIKAESILSQIAKKLSSSKSSDPVVQQCLSLIGGHQNIDKNDSKSKQKLIKEIQRLTLEKEKAYQANQMLAQKAKESIKRLKEVIKTQAEQLEQVESLKGQLKSVNAAKTSLEHSLSQQQTENVKQSAALKELHRKIKENESMKEASMSKYKEESELQLSSLQEELDNWKKKSEINDATANDEIRKLKQGYKLRMRKMQNDLIAQVQKVTDTRNHFEPILADLRQKLNSAKASEVQMQNDLEKAENEKKQMKAELSSARIDMKMMQMKLSAAEEKMKREKSMIESQFKIKLAGQESRHQSAIDDQKNKFDSMFHSFLVSVCEKFKDFVDFNEMITEESVKKTLSKVSYKLSEYIKKEKEFDDLNSQISNLRSLLGIQPKDSILPAISAITKEASEYNRLRDEIEEKQNELDQLIKNAKIDHAKQEINEEWDQWARRLFSLISDNFGSAHSTKDLQFALEESLLGNNIGQRLNTRRLHILRFEKRLFLSGFLETNSKTKQNNNKTKNENIEQPPTSIKHILIVIACIRQMQKISGHMKCEITLPSKKKENLENHIHHKQEKHFPILNIHDV